MTWVSAAAVSRFSVNGPAAEGTHGLQHLAKAVRSRSRGQFLLRRTYGFFDAAMQPLPKFKLERENYREQNTLGMMFGLLGATCNERQHVMSPKTTISALSASLAIASLAILLPLTSDAQAQAARATASWQAAQCRIVGSISHRCYFFHSDAAFPQGLADYHGSNGGG
jgi:hypothetical protein